MKSFIILKVFNGLREQLLNKKEFFSIPILYCPHKLFAQSQTNAPFEVRVQMKMRSNVRVCTGEKK